MRDIIGAAIIMPLALALTAVFLFGQIRAYGSVRETAILEAIIVREVRESKDLLSAAGTDGHPAIAANAELAHLSADILLDLLRLYQNGIGEGTADGTDP